MHPQDVERHRSTTGAESQTKSVPESSCSGLDGPKAQMLLEALLNPAPLAIPPLHVAPSFARAGSSIREKVLSIPAPSEMGLMPGHVSPAQALRERIEPRGPGVPTFNLTGNAWVGYKICWSMASPTAK